MASDGKAVPILSLWRKLLFGAAAPPLHLTGNVVGFYHSIFLLEVAKLSPVFVSAISFTGRAWDAVTDPLVGQLVANSSSRFGKTRPWILASSIVGSVAFCSMWLCVPGIESDAAKFAYFLFCYLLYCSLITCYHIPYTSATMLISPSSRDRDDATAAKIVAELLSTIVGCGAFGAVINATRVVNSCPFNMLSASDGINGSSLVNGSESFNDTDSSRMAEARSYALASLGVSLAFLACGLLGFFGIRERLQSAGEEEGGVLSNLRSTLTFRPYIALMLSFLFTSLGIQIVQTNLGLFTTHALGISDAMTYGFVLVLLTATLLLPLLELLNRKFGKKRVYCFGMASSLPVLCALVLLPAECRPCYYAVSAFCGIPVATGMLQPWSMLPDVIDMHVCEGGQRKEATFYSMYVLFTKFATGISVAMSNLALFVANYDENRRCQQPASVGTTLRLLIGSVPVVCLLLALLCMCAYPIDMQCRLRLDAQLKVRGCRSSRGDAVQLKSEELELKISADTNGIQ